MRIEPCAKVAGRSVRTSYAGITGAGKPTVVLVRKGRAHSWRTLRHGAIAFRRRKVAILRSLRGRIAVGAWTILRLRPELVMTGLATEGSSAMTALMTAPIGGSRRVGVLTERQAGLQAGQSCHGDRYNRPACLPRNTGFDRPLHRTCSPSPRSNGPGKSLFSSGYCCPHSKAIQADRAVAHCYRAPADHARQPLAVESSFPDPNW